MVNNPTILAARFRVKFKDVFDMKNLYVMMHEWVKEHEWEDLKKDGDHFETLYIQKDGRKGEKEIWIWWRVEKFPGKNSYYKYVLNIDYHIINLTQTEIMYEGKKLKVNKGIAELKIRSYIEIDYKGEWSSHPILNFFKDIFKERIFKSDLDTHKKELYREAYILQGAIKKYLKLKGFLPEYKLEPFHPTQAYPSWK